MQSVRIRLTVKTEKVLFRQCGRIRTASWGSKVRESELRDQQAVSIVCLEQNTNQHVLHSLSVKCCFSSVPQSFCQFLSTFCAFPLPFVYIFNHLVWVFLLGSLPLVVTLNQSCFQFFGTVFSRRAGPSQNNAVPPLVQSLSGPCNWSQCSP